MERLHGRAWGLAALALLPLLAAACGGDSAPPAPSPTTYTLTVLVRDEAQRAVTGAVVRITDGPNFGRNATTDTSGTATLSGLSSGSCSLEVTATGFQQTNQPVTLTASQSVTVQLKVTPSAPPVIESIAAKGALPNEPPNYSDAGEPLTVTAKVSDTDTAIDKLTYEWSVDSGTITPGAVTETGPSATWRPATTGGGNGATAMITLTVIEKYGPTNSLENRVQKSQKVVIHDSRHESGDLSTLFLTEFSNSSIPDASYVTRNFTDRVGCGKAEETSEITLNRKTRTITAYALGSPSVSLSFGGTCHYQNRPGDACVTMTCEWRDKDSTTGVPAHVSGMCYLTTVYDQTRDAWQLCWSNFDGITLPSGRVIRTLGFR